MPMKFFRRKAEDRMRIRERLMHMGQLKYILTVGLLGSGLTLGLAMATFDLCLDPSPHDWPREVFKVAFLSLFYGLLSGAIGWDAAFSDKGDPPPIR
jgi:hypothetical protein